MSDNKKRGSGRTSKQMKEAAPSAVFVWCNGHLGYPRALAQHLGRSDLRIVSSTWAEDQRFMGLRVQIVVDHAACLIPPIRDAISVRNSMFGAGEVNP